MFEALCTVLETGLSLWLHKDKEKYLDKVVDLRRRYREATNRPDSEWDDAVIDGLEFELRLAALGFSAQARESNTPNQP